MVNHRIRGAALLAAALVLLPRTGSAQDLESACAAIAGSTTGAWTEHVVDSPNGTFDVRFALVSSRGGTWYELRSQTAVGVSILQLRVPGFPFTPAEIEQVVTKTGTGPALVVPDGLVAQYKANASTGPMADIEAQCRTAEVVGQEEVSVPAGTFTTTHLRFPATGGEVWVSADVPFGVVRGDIPGQGTTELKAHGGDATSSITETPISLQGGGAGAGSSP